MTNQHELHWLRHGSHRTRKSDAVEGVMNDADIFRIDLTIVIVDKGCLIEAQFTL
jgi:hypothetical protein